MLTDIPEMIKEDTESANVPADVTDDSCTLKFIEIVPLTRNTGSRYTTEYDSEAWSAEVIQENKPIIKQEPNDVCHVYKLFVIASFNLKIMKL